MKNLHKYGTPIWVEQEPNDILSNNVVNKASHQRTLASASDIVKRWHPIIELEQGSIADRHIGDNEIHGITGQENIETEVYQKCIKDIRFFGMEMVHNELYNSINSIQSQTVETQVEQTDRNCQQERKSEDQESNINYQGDQLLKDVVGRCIIVCDDIAQSINISSIQEYLERHMQEGEKITGRPDLVVRKYQEELAKLLREYSTQRNINHGCFGNQLRSCLETSTNRGGSNLQDMIGVNNEYNKLSKHREMTAILMAFRNYHKILHKEVESQIGTITECEKDQEAIFGEQSEIGNGAYSKVQESNCRLSEPHCSKFGLLCEAKNVGLSIGNIKTSCTAELLNLSNQQTSQKLLQLATLPPSLRNKRLQFQLVSKNPFLLPSLSQVLDGLRKVTEDKAEAVLIISDWKGQVRSRCIEDMTMEEVDFSEADVCFGMGQVVKDPHQQLPSGRMKDVRQTSVHQENSYKGKLANELDQKMKL
ncbi:MAG: hypothetical protein EZS28_014345 [Streblomastix strix]|uniref:Uncharacterized protein n=1 Tax=Streblomastix strix TaxID=222440 RepID=A0A5J4W6N3_9EUKA|nr:MAG: hypothetical protein EZS28_014345 [Streblomastix strix]